MRISAKGRYGLAAMSYLASNYKNGMAITVLHISETMGISKIYLEQVFSLLKRAGLVISIKGSQGGYFLNREPNSITAYDVLTAIEIAMVEKTDSTVEEKQPLLDKAMQEIVFSQLDDAVKSCLEEITLEDILNNVEKQKEPDNLMYFI
ncbi:RrF2 family transcriptional regulator [Anaerovibrio lipolyticus]|uniref:RrF2 family transcriptional regulator n=1 Tax=Anaerovibrio lipolyticus TaxID=82374 RepID=UPI00048980DF|nr:Rrf2 family transcriptional regulator [Anaerovibrio lipolyticus]